MKSHRKGNRRSRSSRGGNSLQSAIFNYETVVEAFRVTQTSSGTGGLTAVSSLGSASNASSVSLDPFTIGGNLAEVAALFTKYRIKTLKISYVSEETSSGVLESAAGTTTTPSYGSRVFAWGINRDPALSTLTYAGLVQMGARVGNTSKSQTLTFKNNDPEWYFTSTTAASPTTLDQRLAAPLQLRFAYFTTSTTANTSYGHLLFHIRCQFQGSVPNSTPLGVYLSGETKTTPPLDGDEFSDIVEVERESKESSALCTEKKITVQGFTSSSSLKKEEKEEDYENPIMALFRVADVPLPKGSPTLQQIIEVRKVYQQKLDIIDGVVKKGGM